MLLTNIFSNAILLANKKNKYFLGGLFMWFDDELDGVTKRDKLMSFMALAYLWSFKF